MGCIQSFIQECLVINSISWPGCKIQLFERSFWLVNYIMMGYLSKGKLVAVILSMCLANICMLFLEGLLSAQDYFMIQCKGNEKKEKYWLIISSIIVLLNTILTVFVLIIFDFVIDYNLQLKSVVITRIVLFTWFILPCFFFHGLTKILQQYAIFKQISIRVNYSLGLGIVFNILGNYIFVYVLKMNYVGCALSSSISKALIFFILYAQLFGRSELYHYFREPKKIFEEFFDKVIYAIYNAFRHEKKSSSRVRKAKMNLKKRNDKSSTTPQEGITLGGDIEMKPTNVHKKRSIIVHNELAKGNAKFEDFSEDSDDDYISDEDERRNFKTSIRTNQGDDDDLDENSDLPLLESSIFKKRNILANVLRYIIIGFPSATMLGIDSWPYEISGFLVANLGTVSVCSHQMAIIFIQYIAISFLLPLSNANALRIHSLMKASRPQEAFYSCLACLFQCFTVSAFFGLIFILIDNEFAFLYTLNQDIRYRTSRIMYFVVGFFVPYSVQIGAQSVLRALYYQWENLGLSFLSLWIFGYPIGIYLAYEGNSPFDLEGIWIGMIVGIGVQTFTLLIFINSINWEKESKRVQIRSSQHSGLSTEMTPVVQSNILLFPSVSSRAMGGFEIRAMTQEEEMAELEQIEFENEELLSLNL